MMGINNVLNSNQINAQTGTTYQLVPSDFGKLITVNNSSGVTITLPEESTVDLGTSFYCWIRNIGTGEATLVKEGEDALVGNTILVNQAEFRIQRTTSTTWAVFGSSDTVLEEYTIPVIKAATANDLAYFTIFSAFNGEILSCSQLADSFGTAGDYTIAIGATPVTGLTNVVNTTARTTSIATGANSFSVGSTIRMKLGNTVATGVNVSFTLLCARSVPTVTPPPLTVGGLVLWFDAADATTITSASNLVSEWRDKSGNAFNITQATGANQPTYQPTGFNLGVIDFGAGDYMVGSTSTMLDPLTGTITLFAVNKVNNGASTAFYYQKGQANASSDGWAVVGSIEGPRAFTSTNDSRQISSAFPMPYDYQIISSVYTPTGVEGYINGAAVSGSPTASYTGTITTVNPFTLNANFDGAASAAQTVAEVLVFKKNLSASEKLTINRYLANKWGIQL